MRKPLDGRWFALFLLGLAALCCWTMIQPSGLRATEPPVVENPAVPCVDCFVDKILLPQTGDPEKDAALVRQLSDATQQHYADLYRRQKELTWRQWQGTKCTVPPDIAADERPVFEFAAQYIATWELGSEARKESFPTYCNPEADLICVGWNIVILNVEEGEEHILVEIKANPKLSSLMHRIPFTPQCSVETWKLSSDSEPVCLERRLDGPGFLIGG